MVTSDFDTDTIVAVSTPSGNSLKGIIRLSGPDAFRIIRSSFSPRPVMPPRRNQVIDGTLKIRDGDIPASLFIMKAPHSYTREDIAEIHTIGAQVLLQMIIAHFTGKGARLARPGEFTKRAFLNGRLSLSEAEAVLDVIKSRSDREFQLAQSHLEGHFTGRIITIKRDLVDLLSRIELALDFSDQELEVITPAQVRDILKRAEKTISHIISGQSGGQVHKGGVMCILCGRTNVGKSSLFNRLVPDRRNIVSPIAGTTRDYIEGALEYSGERFRIFDTAGLAKTAGELSADAQRRSSRLAKDADICLMVIDGHLGLTAGDCRIMRRLNRRSILRLLEQSDLQPSIPGSNSLRSNCQSMILVINKCDLGVVRKSVPAGITVVKTSARTGQGIAELKRAISKSADRTDRSVSDMSVNARHRECLSRSLTALRRGLTGLDKQGTLELVALDLRDALNALGEIVGETVTDDILDNIFSRFCIGK